MSMRWLLLWTLALGANACADPRTLSAPKTWGEDFLARSPPTEHCPGGTVSHLRTQMAVEDARTQAQFDLPIEDAIRSKLEADDRFHRFRFSTDPDAEPYWGFEGVLIARRDCIVHVEITGYDN